MGYFFRRVTPHTLKERREEAICDGRHFSDPTIRRSADDSVPLTTVNRKGTIRLMAQDTKRARKANSGRVAVAEQAKWASRERRYGPRRCKGTDEDPVESTRRLPFAPLAAWLGVSENELGHELTFSGSTARAVRAEGLDVYSADRIAVYVAGVHPSAIWGPDWFDAVDEVDSARAGAAA